MTSGYTSTDYLYLFIRHLKRWRIKGVYIIALYKSTFTYLQTNQYTRSTN